MSSFMPTIRVRPASEIVATPIKPVRLSRMERGLRIRDIILALIHACHVPPVMEGFMRYDFGFFEVAFIAYAPLEWHGAPSCQMYLYADYTKVLGITWDDDPDVAQLSCFKPSWWEDEITDINFWADKPRWYPVRDWTVPVSAEEGLDMPGWSSGAEPLMQQLRDRAHRYALQRMETGYAMGDLERGQKWEALAAMIELNDAPIRSSFS